jgi:hypothetical protein
MQAAVMGLTLLECTAEGRAHAEAYLAQEQAKRTQAEQATLEALRAGHFRDASLAVATFEAAQVFPRGLNMDWQHFDPAHAMRFL